MQSRVAWLDLIKATLTQSTWMKEIFKAKENFLCHWHKPELAKEINQKRFFCSRFIFPHPRSTEILFQWGRKVLWFRFSNSFKRKNPWKIALANETQFILAIEFLRKILSLTRDVSMKQRGERKVKGVKRRTSDKQNWKAINKYKQRDEASYSATFKW